MIEKWLHRRSLAPVALPVAALAAVGMIVISEWAYHGAESRLTRVVAMGAARLQILHLLRRTTEAESAKRGYILAGGDEYLQPYENARADVNQTLGRLTEHFQQADDAEGVAMMADLRRVVEAKFGEMSEVKRLHDAGQTAQAMDVIRSGIGRELMERLRTESDRLLAHQNLRIKEGLGGVYNTLQLNRIGVAAMTAVSMLLLVLFLRVARALAAEQEARQQTIRDERDRLEAEVARRTADLTELARHLQSAREDERSHIARDLHDELGALLTAAKLDVARIKPPLQQLAPELVPRLNHLTDALNGGIALKRRIIEDLRPSSLNSLGLKAALEILCTEFGERCAVSMNVSIDSPPLRAGLDIAVYRMVQEALTNIGKYAQAREVWVSVQAHGNDLHIEVRDDGLGFDVQAIGRGHHGLRGMRFRVQAHQGQLQVDSAPGQGTRLMARVPLVLADDAPARV